MRARDLILSLVAPLLATPLLAQSVVSRPDASSAEPPAAVVARDSRDQTPPITSNQITLLRPSIAITGPCYTMRSYQMTPTSPGSGVAKLTGYSTCQPSARIHFKSAQAEESR